MFQWRRPAFNRYFRFELPLHPETYASYPVVSSANRPGLFEVMVGISAEFTNPRPQRGSPTNWNCEFAVATTAPLWMNEGDEQASQRRCACGVPKFDVESRGADSRVHLVARSSRSHWPSRRSTRRSRRSLFWPGIGSAREVFRKKPCLLRPGANLIWAASLLRCDPVSQW